MKKLVPWILLGIVILLTACAPATPEPLELMIEMTEYAYNPENIELRVGQQVILHLINTGQLEHELVIGRNLSTTDNRPNGYQVDFFESAGVLPMVEFSDEIVMDESKEDAGHTHQEDDPKSEDANSEVVESHAHEEADAHEHEHAGFLVALPQGSQEATLTFTVTEDMVGEWELGCFVEDGLHYDAGMHGILIVKP